MAQLLLLLSVQWIAKGAQKASEMVAAKRKLKQMMFAVRDVWDEKKSYREKYHSFPVTLWNHDQVDVSSLPSISITLGQYYTSHALLQRPWFQDMWVLKKTVIPRCEVWSWDLHLQNRVSHLGATEQPQAGDISLGTLRGV